MEPHWQAGLEPVRLMFPASQQPSQGAGCGVQSYQNFTCGYMRGNLPHALSKATANALLQPRLSLPLGQRMNSWARPLCFRPEHARESSHAMPAKARKLQPTRNSASASSKQTLQPSSAWAAQRQRRAEVKRPGAITRNTAGCPTSFNTKLSTHPCPLPRVPKEESEKNLLQSASGMRSSTLPNAVDGAFIAQMFGTLRSANPLPIAGLGAWKLHRFPTGVLSTSTCHTAVRRQCAPSKYKFLLEGVSFCKARGRERELLVHHLAPAASGQPYNVCEHTLAPQVLRKQSSGPTLWSCVCQPLVITETLWN